MRNDTRGYTLFELLIVIAIIAVLAAISIPVFSENIEKARRTADIENARTIYTEVNTLIVDGKLQIFQDDVGIVIWVGKRKVIIEVCKGKDIPKTGLVSRKAFSMGKELKQTIIKVINPDVRCKQQRIDWYAIAIYGDGSSYYWENRGTSTFKGAKRYTWAELSN